MCDGSDGAERHPGRGPGPRLTALACPPSPAVCARRGRDQWPQGRVHTVDARGDLRVLGISRSQDTWARSLFVVAVQSHDAFSGTTPAPFVIDPASPQRYAAIVKGRRTRRSP